MSKFKEYIAFKTITVLLVAVMYTPTLVKLVHIFEHHEHVVCIAEKSTHFHQVDLDCEFHKFPLNKNITFASFIVDLFSEKEFLLEIESQYVFLSKYQRLHFSLRGPPAINLS